MKNDLPCVYDKIAEGAGGGEGQTEDEAVWWGGARGSQSRDSGRGCTLRLSSSRTICDGIPSCSHPALCVDAGCWQHLQTSTLYLVRLTAVLRATPHSWWHVTGALLWVGGWLGRSWCMAEFAVEPSTTKSCTENPFGTGRWPQKKDRACGDNNDTPFPHRFHTALRHMLAPSLLHTSSLLILHHTRCRGRLECAKALLRAGADPNFINGAGDLTLFWGIDGGPAIIQLLLRCVVVSCQLAYVTHTSGVACLKVA